MHSPLQTLIYGFAIFAMFFGSGNLVFPLQIGLGATPHWFVGFLGLFITGILLPFLGLFVIKLHHGKYEDFFAEGGKIARFLLPLFTLSLLGAFGVVPRCITVAHGGIEALFPEVSLIAFSTFFCFLCFLICLKDHWVISILGKWMTPLLLVSLILLITLGIFHAPDHINLLPAVQKTAAFQEGFLRGYQTMDLFAAFFFSALIFKHIQNSMPKHSSPKKVIRAALTPSLIGAGLLAAVYLGFVYLGSHYHALIQTAAPTLLLPMIALSVLGEKAALWIGIIVVFSCLTTAVALNNIYARYLCTLFKLKNTHYPLMLFLTTVCAFLISLLDFRGIATFLAPMLEVSYPSLIGLTILGVILKDYQKAKITVFYGILILTIAIYVWP